MQSAARWLLPRVAARGAPHGNARRYTSGRIWDICRRAPRVGTSPRAQICYTAWTEGDSKTRAEAYPVRYSGVDDEHSPIPSAPPAPETHTPESHRPPWVARIWCSVEVGYAPDAARAADLAAFRRACAKGQLAAARALAARVGFTDAEVHGSNHRALRSATKNNHTEVSTWLIQEFYQT